MVLYGSLGINDAFAKIQNTFIKRKMPSFINLLQYYKKKHSFVGCRVGAFLSPPVIGHEAGKH
jgi:hypothetical protein